MAQGFAHYDYAPATNAFTRRADAVVDGALAWIDERGSAPFFLLVHLFDPHMNYDAPPPWRGRLTGPLGTSLALPVADVRALRRRAPKLAPEERRFVTAAYDEEVAFATAQVARLLGGLAERDLLERGLVILTSDHGEELFEHGGFEHGHAFWQELLALPLVVWGAGVIAGDEPAPVSLVDLAPTLLEAVGLPALPAVDGVSLWQNLTRGRALPERALIAEGSLYGPERKVLIRWPAKLVWEPDTGEGVLYRLDADPGERRPLDDWAQAEALAEELAARVERAPGAPVELPPDAVEALRELGYVE